MTSLLIVEDGTGVENADSYATAADTTTYWTARPTASLSNAWVTADDANKDSALRMATDYLDFYYDWMGYQVSGTQSLKWPRNGVYDALRNPYTGVIPPALKRACMELAARALAGDLLADSSQEDSVVSEKIGPIETTFRQGSTSVPVYKIVNDILKDLVNSQGTVTLVRA